MAVLHEAKKGMGAVHWPELGEKKEFNVLGP